MLKKAKGIFGIIGMLIKYAPLVMVAVEALKMVTSAYEELAEKEEKQITR